jgi:hypothetical protein
MPSVLAGVHGLTRKNVAMTRLLPGPVASDGAHTTQSFTGETQRAAVAGWHQVGFTGDGDLLACTTLCEGATAACGPLLSEVVVEPPFALRENTATEWALGWALGHPRPVLAVGALIAVVGVTVLLWKRPRPSTPATAREKIA